MKKSNKNNKLTVMNRSVGITEKKVVGFYGIRTPRDEETERSKHAKLRPYNAPPWKPIVIDERGEICPKKDFRDKMPPLMESKSWTKAVPYKVY